MSKRLDVQEQEIQFPLLKCNKERVGATPADFGKTLTALLQENYQNKNDIVEVIELLLPENIKARIDSITDSIHGEEEQKAFHSLCNYLVQNQNEPGVMKACSELVNAEKK